MNTEETTMNTEEIYITRADFNYACPSALWGAAWRENRGGCGKSKMLRYVREGKLKPAFKKGRKEYFRLRDALDLIPIRPIRPEDDILEDLDLPF